MSKRGKKFNGTVFSPLYDAENYYDNNMAWYEYYNKYTLLALSMFEWKGLPESCNADFLEKTLFYKGQAAFLEILPTPGAMNLQVTPTTLDAYGFPLEFLCTSVNGSISVTRTNKDCVYVRNNRLAVPTSFTIETYAKRLYEIQMTIDVNLYAQKTPILILCDDPGDKLSLQNIYKQYRGNHPVIFADKKRINRETIAVLETNAPFLIPELYLYKQNIENELLKNIGITTNARPDKKERLIVSENNSIVDVTKNMGNIYLTTRQEAAKAVNEMFNWNCSVDYAIKPLEDEKINSKESDGEKDGV